MELKVLLTAAFFVHPDGPKIDEPVVIWKAKNRFASRM